MKYLSQQRDSPDIVIESLLAASGFKPNIGVTPWLVTEVETRSETTASAREYAVRYKSETRHRP